MNPPELTGPPDSPLVRDIVEVPALEAVEMVFYGLVELRVPLGAGAAPKLPRGHEAPVEGTEDLSGLLGLLQAGGLGLGQPVQVPVASPVTSRRVVSGSQWRSRSMVRPKGKRTSRNSARLT